MHTSRQVKQKATYMESQCLQELRERSKTTMMQGPTVTRSIRRVAYAPRTQGKKGKNSITRQTAASNSARKKPSQQRSNRTHNPAHNQRRPTRPGKSIPRQTLPPRPRYAAAAETRDGQTTHYPQQPPCGRSRVPAEGGGRSTAVVPRPPRRCTAAAPPPPPPDRSGCSGTGQSARGGLPTSGTARARPARTGATGQTPESGRSGSLRSYPHRPPSRWHLEYPCPPDPPCPPPPPPAPIQRLLPCHGAHSPSQPVPCSPCTRRSTGQWLPQPPTRKGAAFARHGVDRAASGVPLAAPPDSQWRASLRRRGW